MIDGRLRPLTAAERRLFQRILEPRFPGRDALAQQLDGLLVSDIDQFGSLSLKVAAPVVAPIEERVPVEARYLDVDTKPDWGPYVHILLHIVEGKMYMLEVYKDCGSITKKYTDVEDLEVSAFNNRKF